MPAPTTYTETTLKALLVAILSDVATMLGWTTASTPIVEALYDTEFALGVSDVATATNMLAVRRVAAAMAWRQAAAALGARVDTRTGDVDHKWSQRHAAALQQLAAAEAAALPYLSDYAVRITPVTFPQDPYAAVATSAQVWP